MHIHVHSHAFKYKVYTYISIYIYVHMYLLKYVRTVRLKMHMPHGKNHIFSAFKHSAVLPKGVLPVHGLVLKLGHDPQVIYIAIHLGGAEVAGLVPLRTLPVLLVVRGPS